MAHFEVQTRDDSVVGVFPGGILDITCLQDARNLVNVLASSNRDKAILCFDGVERVNSAIVGIIFRFAVSMKKRGRTVELSNVPKNLLDIFNRVGWGHIFPEYVCSV